MHRFGESSTSCMALFWQVFETAVFIYVRVYYIQEASSLCFGWYAVTSTLMVRPLVPILAISVQLSLRGSASASRESVTRLRCRTHESAAFECLQVLLDQITRPTPIVLFNRPYLSSLRQQQHRVDRLPDPRTEQLSPHFNVQSFTSCMSSPNKPINPKLPTLNPALVRGLQHTQDPTRGSPPAALNSTHRTSNEPTLLR
jgi:hypothetical protein